MMAMAANGASCSPIVAGGPRGHLPAAQAGGFEARHHDLEHHVTVGQVRTGPPSPHHDDVAEMLVPHQDRRDMCGRVGPMMITS